MNFAVFSTAIPCKLSRKEFYLLTFYLDIADIYLAKGLYEEALREYGNALKLESGEGAALRGRAKAMEMMRWLASSH